MCYAIHMTQEATATQTLMTPEQATDEALLLLIRKLGRQQSAAYAAVRRQRCSGGRT